MSVRLLLVGCGKMGGAMLGGWLDRGLEPAGVVVVEPSEVHAAAVRGRGIAVLSDATSVAAGFRPDVVVLAVKPQAMDAAAAEHRRWAGPTTVFLSIAAGKTLGYFRSALGEAAAVVRAMPNTPAAVRRGVTVACGNPLVGAAAQRLCHDLLEAVGEVHWIDDESLMDPVTAVSGSGPAYVFLLVETLARAGVEAGLPEDLAARLARATVAGSGELLRVSTASAETLRHNVTSPGGTTAAALEVLLAEPGLSALMVRAVAAARDRSRELAG